MGMVVSMLGKELGRNWEAEFPDWTSFVVDSEIEVEA
jgi:hypothetical protein